MMKKIFSKCFMVAAMVAAVGTISSCKDYNDEIVANSLAQDANLQEQIDALKQKHNDDLDAAKAERDRIEGELDQHIADAEAKYATKAELETAKAELAAADAALKAELEATINELENADAVLKAELEEKIKGLQAEINTLTSKLGTLESELSATNTKIDELKKELEDKIGKISQCECDIAKLEKVVTDLAALSGRVEALEGKIGTLATQEQLKELKAIVEGLVSCGCGDLLDKVTGIEGQLPLLATLADLSTLKSDIESDSIRIDKLQETIADLKESIKCDSLAAALEALEAEQKAEIAIIESNMENLYNLIVTNLDLAYNYTDDAIAALKDYVVPEIDGIKALLNQVRIDVETLKPLQAAVADLQTKVAANTAAIDALTQRVDDLEGDVNDLENALEQRISSVNIQGAYSPVIGYFKMPMGIKSNIVASYYGEFATGETEINFPFVYSSSMLDGNFNSLNDLKASLGYAGETFDALNDGKAGKIYLTINPAEVNLDSVDFALVNSLGENAPVELTVKPSEDKLSFGYTRAGGVALYEAAATITDTDATDFDLNVADYKEVFRDLKNGGDINLSLIVEALYGTFNNIADANAVSATWTDAMGHSHTVLSNYDIAALSVQPLSFSFMKDVKVESMPGFNKISKVIDNIINRVDVEIHIGNFEDVKFNLTKLELDEDKFIISIDTTLTIEGQEVVIYEKGEVSGFYVEVEGVEYPLEVKEDVTVSIEDQTVNFTYENSDFVSEILKIEDMVNTELDEIKGLIDQVNDMLAELRETDQQLNQSIDDAKNNVKAELNKYLDKLNNRLCGMFNSINSKLQPVLLANNGNFALLSQSESRPVEIANEITLVPTTYTGELLAPAFKKYVAITAVNGSTDNLAAINAAAGEDLNKVLDGDIREITFKGESGNTYEITYSALDYAGFVVNTKYYVTVK